MPPSSPSLKGLLKEFPTRLGGSSATRTALLPKPVLSWPSIGEGGTGCSNWSNTNGRWRCRSLASPSDFSRRSHIFNQCGGTQRNHEHRSVGCKPSWSASSGRLYSKRLPRGFGSRPQAASPTPALILAMTVSAASFRFCGVLSVKRLDRCWRLNVRSHADGTLAQGSFSSFFSSALFGSTEGALPLQ
jgi:hypothetical protein